MRNVCGVTRFFQNLGVTARQMADLVLVTHSATTASWEDHLGDAGGGGGCGATLLQQSKLAARLATLVVGEPLLRAERDIHTPCCGLGSAPGGGNAVATHSPRASPAALGVALLALLAVGGGSAVGGLLIRRSWIRLGCSMRLHCAACRASAVSVLVEPAFCSYPAFTVPV